MDDKLERAAAQKKLTMMNNNIQYGDFSLEHIHYDSKTNTVYAYLIRPIKYIELNIKLGDCINYD